MTVILIVVLLVAVGLGGLGWWWRSNAFERFFATVKDRLLDLKLVVHRVPEAAAHHLVSESIALFRAQRGFNPKRLAMRYFTWYAVEYKACDRRAFTDEAVLIPAMQKMRDWGQHDPALKQAAETEIGKITEYLHDLIETSTMATDHKLAQQAQLLHWAAGEPAVDWKAEMEKAVKAAEAK